MLSTIAAIITVVGSLFAATSALIERERLKRERSGRERTQELIALRVEQSRVEGLSVAERERLLDEARVLERTLHKAAGRTPPPTYGEVQISLSMSAQPTSNSDALRQWVLLVSSAIGVILVAVDVSTTSVG